MSASYFDKKLRSANARSGATEARRRDLIEACLPPGLLIDDIHPNDLRTLDAMVRLAQTDVEYAATMVLRGVYGSRLGEATVAGTTGDPELVVTAESAVVDSLSGLPGRTLLLDRIAHALGASSLKGAGVATIWCDVDRFGALNELAGYDSGNDVLAELANTLQIALRENDELGRIGNDDFIVIAPNVADAQDCQALGERLMSVLHRSRLRSFAGVTASLGISFGTASDDPAQLLWRAEQAVRKARSAGGDHFVVFDDDLASNIERRRHLSHQLHRAFDDHSIDVDLQPIIDIVRGGLYGLEALLRLRVLEETFDAGPGELIRLADETGILTRVEGAVLGIACARLVRSLDRYPALRLAVNITGRQLRSADQAVVAMRVLESAGVSPSRVDLEVAASAAREDLVGSRRGIERLSELGFRVVIDNFDGSPMDLRMFAELGASAVKLSPQLLVTCQVRALAALIELCNDLGLSATAVGVETEEQLESVRQAGFRLAQGFFLSPPLSPEQIDELGFLREGDPV